MPRVHASMHDVWGAHASSRVGLGALAETNFVAVSTSDEPSLNSITSKSRRIRC